MFKSTPFLRLMVAFAIALHFSLASACAEFAISVGSGTIDAGGDLLLEIGIESDTPPQDLAEFELILEITPLSAAPGSSLVFVEPQSEAFLADADYIFAATSESVIENLPSTQINSGNRITLYDLSVDALGDPMNVPVTSGHLLASVDVRHQLGGAIPVATAGDQFEVRVDLTSFFTDESEADLDISVSPGVVTVGAVAIPEPGAAAMLMLASAGVFLRRRRS
ncbi:PEP-CTERM sorting domain-containing protein [Stieleria mannarensis]|uniref:PEP-CTERM sorting domain-containing protein n=1 Tax=Stieleria mannarensis TaxID=2755585 RepID=UPI0015FF7AA9|nr:PEP-CTERM sorting domain-containing protein [Rhodopirellula sp. JC639]